MAIRRTWAEDQDFILKMLRQQKKINKWSSIARIMDIEYNLPGRTGKQCRQRYNNHLDQKIVSQEFSYENQKLLEKLHNQIGNKWAVISTHFNGRQNQFYERTANFLKNQLYSKLRKAVRRLNKFIKDHNMKKITKQFKLNIVFKIIQTNDYKFSEKQLHSKEDLYFYEGNYNFMVEVKKNMLEYAEQNMTKQSINCKDSIYYKNNESNSKKLIELLNLFLTKFSFFKNKRKINRNYQKQDQIIINSFSNNPQQKKNKKKSQIKKYKSLIYEQKPQMFMSKAVKKGQYEQSQKEYKDSSLKIVTSNTINDQKYKEAHQTIEKEKLSFSLNRYSGRINENQNIRIQNEKIINDSDIGKTQQAMNKSYVFQNQIFQEQSQNHQSNLMDAREEQQQIDQSLFY